MEDADEKSYTEIAIRRVTVVTDGAALIEIDRYCFTEKHLASFRTSAPTLEVWFPKSMMRQLDGSIYLNTFIARQKGLQA